MLLKAKAVDDDCENLWRIHNSLYDLSQWVNKHPGEFVGERKFRQLWLFSRRSWLDSTYKGDRHYWGFWDVACFWSVSKTAPKVLCQRNYCSEKSQVNPIVTTPLSVSILTTFFKVRGAQSEDLYIPHICQRHHRRCLCKKNCLVYIFTDLTLKMGNLLCKFWCKFYSPKILPV